MMDEFLTQQKWYYMGPDETIYGCFDPFWKHNLSFFLGPFSSHEMYVWLQHRYFNDNLQLKTDKDEQFYSLADWVQACGNQVSPLIHQIDKQTEGAMLKRNF